MNLDRFRLATALRVFLLTCTLSLFAYLLFHSDLYKFAALMAVLAAYQVFALARWIEKKNRNLARFLEAIEAEDFTQTFSIAGKSRAFDELNRTFNRITRRFEEMRAEREDQFQYFQFVVERLSVGLIVFRQDGKVDVINRAARRLLGMPSLRNVKELSSLSTHLLDAVRNANRRGRNLVRVENANLSARLAIQTSEFRMRGINYTLASLQDMRGEMEEIELDAWQNLIRVLTHEIVNSIAPIASLASTANRLLTDSGSKSQQQGEAVPAIFDDVQTAVRTIEARSEGLLRFVNSYRTLTHVPEPKFKIFPIMLLFRRVEQLVSPTLKTNSVRLTITVEPDSLELTADPDLLEQVLLNLVMNSIQALDGRTDGQIELSARLEERGKTTIRVEDNGAGIPRDVQEKIFIPFFTTKESGSGIGLSLSRQILHLHRALISVWSKPGERTVFTIVF